MARRTKEEAEETRRNLLETALRLFGENGLHKTTLAQIASAAGVTRGAIYWHFKDKVEMLDALFNEEFGPLYADFERQAEGLSDKPLQAIEWVALQFFREMINNPRMKQVLSLFQQLSGDEDFARHCRRSEKEDREQLMGLFRRAEALGLLREGVTVELGVFTFCAFMEGVVTNWLNGTGAIQFTSADDPQIRTVVKVMINGVASDPD